MAHFSGFSEASGRIDRPNQNTHLVRASRRQVSPHTVVRRIHANGQRTPFRSPIPALLFAFVEVQRDSALSEAKAPDNGRRAPTHNGTFFDPNARDAYAATELGRTGGRVTSPHSAG